MHHVHVIPFVLIGLLASVAVKSASSVFEAVKIDTSQVAKSAASILGYKQDIKCDVLLEDISDKIFYNACIEAQNLTYATPAIILFHWNSTLADKFTRCFCGLAIFHLMIPMSKDIYINSSFCTKGSRFACIEICSEDTSSRELSYACGKGPTGQHISRLSTGDTEAVITAVTDGISCEAINLYRRDICDVLYINNTSTNDDGLNWTEKSVIIGANAMVFICIVALLVLAIIIAVLKRAIRKDNNNRDEISEFNDRKSHLYNYENCLYTSLDSLPDTMKNDFISLFESKNVLIQHDNLVIIDEIGQGAFGVVYKGLLVHSAVNVAIKTLKDNSTAEELNDLLSESAMMLELNHPNVLGLLGVCLNSKNDKPLIVLPYMQNGDLKAYLVSQRETVNEDELPEILDYCMLQCMCQDIAKGMEYLSRMKFVHRDLAARNCMVDEYLRVKVADFGFTRDVHGEDYYRLKRRTKLPIKWLSLESLQDNIYNEKTDVWSFGVTCWEVYSLGKTPYPGIDNSEILDHIKKGNRLVKPFLCSDERYSIMMLCWKEKPTMRPSFKDVVHMFEDEGVNQSETDS